MNIDSLVEIVDLLNYIVFLRLSIVKNRFVVLITNSSHLFMHTLFINGSLFHVQAVKSNYRVSLGFRVTYFLNNIHCEW